MTDNVVPIRESGGWRVVDDYARRVHRDDVDVVNLTPDLVSRALVAELDGEGIPTEDAIEHRERLADERREQSREFRVTGVYGLGRRA